MAEQIENKSGAPDELSCIPLSHCIEEYTKGCADSYYYSLVEYDREVLKKSLHIKMYEGKGLFNKGNSQSK